MVAIVSGNSLGLNTTSLATLGQGGTFGTATQGRNGEAAYANIFNGNLVLTDLDQALAGTGLGAGLLRTYNSQGQYSADGWSIGVALKHGVLTGTYGAADSYFTRTDQDGSVSIYHYNSSRGLYESTDGNGAYDSFRQDRSGQYLWTDGASGQQEIYESSGAGRLLSQQDTLGNVVTYSYGSNGLLSRIEDASGESIYLDYAGTQLTQIRSETLEGGLAQQNTPVRYGYDSSGRLAAVTVDLTPNDNSIADGKTYTTQYTYDGSSSRIASVTQSDGTSLSFTYIQVGAQYQVASVADGAGETTHYTYGAGGRPDAVQVNTAGLIGDTITFTFDANGQIVTGFGTAGSGAPLATTYAYDANGNVISATQGGVSVSTAYDAHGNPVSERDAAGNTITRTYADDNRLLTETTYRVPDPDGADSGQPGEPQVTRYVYEAQDSHRLLYTISPEGRITEYRYGGSNPRPVATLQYAVRYDVSALGATASPTLAALATWRASADEANAVRTDATYDFRGQLTSTTTYAQLESNGVGVRDGSEATTHYVYDAQGRLLQTLSPRGETASVVYDGLGRVIATTDTQGNVTQTHYDDANDRLIVTSASGLITVSTYDAAGRLISVASTDAAAHDLGSTRYFYDAKGHLAMTEDATHVRQWLLYDSQDRQVGSIDGNGTLTEYVLDAGGRRLQTLTYAQVVNVAALVDSAGQPLALTLEAVRPAPTAGQDVKAWSLYDAAGRLVKTVDADGSVTELRYDGASRLLATVQYANQLDVSAWGSAVAATDAQPAVSSDDRIARNFYDDDGKLLGSLDAAGYLTTNRYDGAGRLLETTRFATPTALAQRASGALSALVPPPDEADIHGYNFYDARGQLVGTVDGEGYFTQCIYDDDGNLTQRTRYATPTSVVPGAALASVLPGASADDQVQTWAYDSLQRVSSFVDVDGVRTDYTYDLVGHVLTSTRAVNTDEVRTSTARYDLLGRLSGALSGEGSALLTGHETQAQLDALWNQYGIRYAYDAAGRRTSSTDANGHTTLYYYDVEGNPTYTIDAQGGVEERQYDSFGRLSAQIGYSATLSSLRGLSGGLVDTDVTNAVAALANAVKDNRTTYTYDAKGLLTASTDALGHVTAHAYDAFGEETQRIDPVDETRTLVTHYAYDKRGLLIDTLSDVGGLNAETGADYDAFGRLVRTVDANGNASTLSYDKLGRVVATQDPTHSERLTTYDAFGRTLTQYDTVRHTTTQYHYDTAARSVTVTSPEGISVTTTRNRHGQVASVQDGNGNVTTYQYDRNGNLVETDTALTQTQRHYDHANELVETIDANGNTVTYTYDAANRLLTRRLAQPGAAPLVTTYGYDGQGRQIRVTDANQVVTLIDFDAKGQISSQTVDPGGLALVTHYAYDARGKTLLITSPGGSSVQYVYDKLGRRIEEHTDPAGLDLTHTYAYDKNGNVVIAMDPLGNVTRYVVDANDRVIFTVDALGGVTQQSYDSEGRVTRTTQYAQPISLAGLTHTSVLDAASVQARLTPVLDSGITSDRLYDADGRLGWTVDAAGGVVHYDYDDNGNVIDSRAYANAIDRNAWDGLSVPLVIGDEMHDARTHTVYDALNRMRFSIDGTGAVLEQRYDDNGNVTERIAYAQGIAAAVPRTLAALNAAVAVLRDTQHDLYVHQYYDAANRLVDRVDGVGALTHLVYDGNGNLTKQIAYASPIATTADPASVLAALGEDRVTRMTYDKANRLTFTVDALSSVSRRIYDDNGNVVAQVAYASTWVSASEPSDAWLASLFDGSLKDLAQDRVTRYAYDAADRLRYTLDAEGALVGSQYDTAGHLTLTRAFATPVATATLAALPYRATLTSLAALAVQDTAQDRIERSAYDAVGRLVDRIDSAGYLTTSEYDALGRVTATTRYALALSLTVAQYLDPNLLPTDIGLVASAGQDRTDTFAYDAASRLIHSTDASGHSEAYTYDGLNQKIGFQNKNGDLWHYDYDAAGRLVQETAPQVQVTTVLNTGAGLIVDEGSSGLYAPVTRIDYDALGNVIARTEAVGREEARTTRYEYDALGRQIKTLFPQVDVYDAQSGQLLPAASSDLYTQVTYDALGNAVANRDVAGNYSYKRYDLAGRVSYDVDAEGYVTGYTRNVFGDVSQLTRYATRTALTDHSGYGGNLYSGSYSASQVSAAINASGIDHGQDRTLQSSYDRLGRVTQTVQSTTFVYDSGASDTQQQYGWAGATTRNTYNAFGNLVRSATLRNASGAQTWAATTYYYDTAGNLRATIDAAGYLTEQFFDADGHVVAHVEYANKATGVSLSGYTVPTATADDRRVLTQYDANGNKTVDTRQDVEVTAVVFDAQGKSTPLTTRGDLVTRYSYDAVGNLTATTDAAGSTTYSYYDAQGRVTAVQAPDAAVTAFRRDAYGNVVAQVQYATRNDDGLSRTLDVSDPLTRFVAADPAGQDRITLTRYDSHGQAVQTQDANGADSYSAYDASGHLAKIWQSVTGNDGQSQLLFQEFKYDRLGHQIDLITPSSGTSVHYTPAMGVTSAQFSYDVDGYGHLITSDYGNSIHLAWSGANSVSLAWSNLVDVTAGTVRVQVDYVTADTYQTWTSAGADYGPPVSHATGSSPYATQRSQDFAVGDVLQGATLSWTESEGLSAVSAVHIWQQQANGSWALKWEGTPGQAMGAYVDAQAGVQDAGVRYNAFGEVTAKSLNGVDEEYFNYDNAGHLWKTNSGDGVDKVALYDLQGHATASISSDGATSLRYLTADQAAAMGQLRRTDKVYDLVGNVTQERQPLRTVDLGGGVTFMPLSLQYSIGTSAQEVDTDYGVWAGNNQVHLTWPSLAGLGSGEVKVVMDYDTLFTTPPAVDGYGNALTWFDPYGNLLPLGEDSYGNQILPPASWAPQERSITRIFSPEQSAGGVTLDWTEPDGDVGGVSAVKHLTVYKKDADGVWQTIYDRDGSGTNGNAIQIATPTDPGSQVELQMRTVGSGTWVTRALTNFGDAYRFDATGLPAGDYEYQVITRPAGGSGIVTANGSVTLAATPLSGINAGFAFGAAGQGVMTWQAQSKDLVQTFHYRVAGSNGAWQTAPVTYRNNALDGVDLGALPPGQYEYELLWKHEGDVTPFAHATGQVSVSQPVAPVSVAPINSPVLAGVTLTVDTVGVADYGGPVVGGGGGGEYGGGIGGTGGGGDGGYGGHITQTAWVLEWPSTAYSGGLASFHYRVAGATSWQSLPIDISGHKVDLSQLAPANYEYEIVIADAAGNSQSHATGNLTINAQGAGHYETHSVPVQVPVTITPADPSNYITGWTGSGPTYGAPVVVGYDAQGNPICGQGYAREVVGYGDYGTPLYSGRIVVVPYTVYHTEYQQQQVPVQVPVTVTPADPANSIVGWTGTGPTYGAPAVVGYDSAGNPIPGQGYAREVSGYAQDGYGAPLYDQPLYSGRIVAVPYTAYRTEDQLQQVPVQVTTTVTPADPANYIVGWSGGPVYGAPVVVGYEGATPIYGQGYGMVDGQVVAIAYTVYHTEYQQQQVPVQVPTYTPIVVGYDYGQPVYAHDYGGNILYQTDWHTEYPWQQVAVQVPETIYPADPANYLISDHSGSPLYGSPVRVVIGYGDYGTPLYNQPLYGYGQGYGEVGGQVVALPYQETHTEYPWQQVPVQVAYTVTPEDPAHFITSSHSGNPVYGEPVRVVIGYGDYGVPIYGYGQGYGEINGQVVATPYTQMQTQYQWQSVPVQVPTVVYPEDPSHFITSSHSGQPVYGEPVVVGHADYGTPIYGQGYGEVNGQVVAVPYTVWQTQYNDEQVWIDGTTPDPTASDTTPPYTPGYVIPGIPSQFGAGGLGGGGTTAVSEGGPVSINLATGSQNGVSRQEQPVINRTYDRWGNVLSVSDLRSANWLTTYTYNANNQVTSEVLPDADGTSGAGPTTQTYYDTLGNQVAQADARGNVTAQTLDRNGRVIEAHHADGGVEYTFYDTFGNKRATVDAMGNTTSYEYDKDNRLVATTYAPVTSYDSFANRPQNAHTGSLSVRESYDEAGRLLMQTGTDGSVTRYDYDAAGNIIRTTVPGGGVTQDTYDAQGHKTSEIDANGAVATWQYDYFGQVQAHTDIGSAQYSYTYDAARQLTRQTNTRGENLAYAYNEAGQTTRIDDLTLDQHTTYDYDLAGNHVRERTEQGGVVYQDNRISYDALGRLRDIDDGHVHIAIDYDAMGNRTHITSHVMDSADHSDDKQSWYAYDAMNRQILVDGAHNGNADDTGNLTSTQGHRVTYDLNGNRTSDTAWGNVVVDHPGPSVDEYGDAIYPSHSFAASEGLVKTDYRYDAMGRLTVTSENGLTLDHRDYDTGSRVLQSGNDGSLSLDYLKARYGGEGKEGNGAQTIYMSYDAAGRLNFEEVWNRDGTLAYDVRYNAYDPVGNVDQYTVVTDRGTSTETTNVYAPSTVRMEGYKQTGDHLISWTTERQDGESQTLLDVQGNPIGVRDLVQPSYNRDIVNDASGQALYLNQGGHVQRQLIVNGQVLGRYGQEITGSNDDGTAKFGSVTDFNFSYQSIDATSASSGSRYTVAAGDTLQGIAQTLYGDSQLWYVIADANGLQSGQPLRIGQVLDIPAKVGTVHNNAQTYKPYDPSKITGDTAPHLPTPAGSGGSGCGVVGQVIVMVVIIVVCYFTEQWYLMDYGVAEGGATAAGAATYTTSSMVAAGAVGGAAGATAGQLAAMALGMQQNFDWKGVALGAIGGAIGGAFTNTSFVSGSNLANAAMRAAISNALTQGIGLASGLQRRFDWASVAASAAGGAVGAGIGEGLSHSQAFNGLFDSSQSRLAQTLAGTLSAVGVGIASTVVRSGKVDIASIAADAFGNFMAGALASAMVSDGAQDDMAGQGGDGVALNDAQIERIQWGQTMSDVDPYGDSMAGIDASATGAKRRVNGKTENDGARLEISDEDTTTQDSDDIASLDRKADYVNQLTVQTAMARGDSLAPTVANAASLGLFDLSGPLPVAYADQNALNVLGSGGLTGLPETPSGDGSYRPIGSMEGFFTFDPVGRALAGAYSIVPGALDTLEEGGLALYDAIGASTYATLNLATGNEVAYQPTGAIGNSINDRGWLPTIGDGVHGVVANLPGIGLINGLYRQDPEAIGAGIVGALPLVRNAKVGGGANGGLPTGIYADSKGVYGYLPTPGSRYASELYDFTDTSFVARQRDIRVGYLSDTQNLETVIDTMHISGVDAETIARRVVIQRNSQKIEARSLMTPDEVGVLEAGNMKTYGHPVGPTPDQMFKQYGDWNVVIQKSMQKDPAINMLLGLPAGH